MKRAHQANIDIQEADYVVGRILKLKNQLKADETICQ